MAQDFQIIDALPSIGYTPGGQGTPDPFMDAMNEALRKAPSGFVMDNAYVDKAKLERPENFMAPSGPAFAYAGNSNGAAGGDPFKVFQDQLNAIGKEQDPLKKQELMVGVESSFGAHIAAKAKEARTLAEDQLGIKELQANLAQSEKNDRNHPLWDQYQTDSKPTAAIRQRVQQATMQVDNHAQKLLAENPELVRLAKSIDGTLQLQRGLIQKEEENKFKQAKTLAAQGEAAKALVGTVTPEVRASFELANPNLKDDIEFAKYLTSNSKGKLGQDLVQITQGTVTPDNYLQAGVLGNDIALNFAALEQSKRTGLKPEIVRSQLKSAYDFVNNPAIFLSEAAKYSLIKPEEAKKLVSEMTQGKDNKEAAEAGKQKRLNYLDAYMGKMQAKAISQDITSWSTGIGETGIDQAPGAAPVILDLSSKLGRSPSVNEFAQAYLSQPNITKQEKAERLSILGDAYIRNLERAKGGIYGKQIDSVGLANALMTQHAINVVASDPNSPLFKLGQALGNMEKRGADYVTAENERSAANRAAFLSPINNLMSGFQENR